MSSYWHFLGKSWADFNIIQRWSNLRTNVPESNFQKRKLQEKFISTLCKKITPSKENWKCSSLIPKWRWSKHPSFGGFSCHCFKCYLCSLKGPKRELYFVFSWDFLFLLWNFGNCCWSVFFYLTAPHPPTLFLFCLTYFLFLWLLILKAWAPLWIWKGQGDGRNYVSKQHENAFGFPVVNHALGTMCLEPSLSLWALGSKDSVGI